MAAKKPPATTVVKGWVVQFTSGRFGWVNATRPAAGQVLSFNGVAVFLSRENARWCVKDLRRILAPTTRYRLRRATVTLSIAEE